MSNPEQLDPRIEGARTDMLGWFALLEGAVRSGDTDARVEASAAFHGIRAGLVADGVMSEIGSSFFALDVQQMYHAQRRQVEEVLQGVV